MDKVFIFLPEFYIEKYDMKSAKEEYKRITKADTAFDAFFEKFQEAVGLISNVDDEDLSEEELLANAPISFKDWWEENKDTFTYDTPKIRYVKYDYNKSVNENSKKARNNALIQIMSAIFSSPKVVDQISKSGGFEEVQIVSAECDLLSIVTPEERVKICGSPDFGDFYKFITKLDKKTLKGYLAAVAKRLDPLSPLTQLYFHQQNANGGKMIPTYAVGNAIHAEAQWCNLALTKTINLFGKSFSTLDTILSPEGRRISEALGQMLAGSVDNVKDPVLKALNQSPKTAAKSILMLRLGMSIEELGLYMNVNIPKSPIKPNEYPAIEPSTEQLAWVLNTQKLNKGISNPKLYFGILNYLSSVDNELKSAAEALRLITRCARGDSSNASGGPTLGHAILRKLMLQQLSNSMKQEGFPIKSDLLNLDYLLNGDFDNLRECYNSGVPFLQAATKCGVLGPIEILKQYFPQLTDNVLDLLVNEEYGLAKYINFVEMKEDDAIKIINSFFNDYFLYKLNDSEFFGTNGVAESKQTNFYQYAINFPEYLRDLIKKYPDLKQRNEFIARLDIHVANAYQVIPKIKFKSTGNLSKARHNEIAKNWEALIYDENPEISRLGYQLFKYAQFYGLTYSGPQSLTQFTPNAIRTNVPNYVDVLESTLTDNTEIDKPFVLQYIRNNYLYKFSTSFTDKEAEYDAEGNLILPSRYKDKVFVKKYDADKKQFEFYMKNENLTEGSKNVYFTRVTVLGHQSGIKEYYYGLVNVDSVIPQVESKRKSNQYVNIDSSSNIESINTDDEGFEGVTNTDVEKQNEMSAIDNEWTPQTIDDNGDNICFEM